MRTPRLFVLLTTFVCCLLLPQYASGEALIEGSSSVTYNAWTNTVTGTSTTQLDYSAQDWYQGRVSSALTDANGNLLASASVYDLDRDGTVTVTTQTAGVDQMEYTNTSMHFAKADIQDYNLGGGYYVDYWNFQAVATLEAGIYHYLYMPFYAYGPSRTTRLQNLRVGNTYATVQAKARVAIENYGWSEDPPVIVNDGTDSVGLSVGVSASQNPPDGIKPGDKVQLDITSLAPGASMNAVGTNLAGQNVQGTTIGDVTAGGTTNAVFTTTTNAENTYTGDVQFRVRIVDVFRRDQSGVWQSIYGKVYIPNANDGIVTSNSPTTKTLRVNPKP